MNEPITIIDYGAGNIRSVQKAFEHLGARVHLSADPGEIVQAQKLVLPGVGAFGAGMAALRRQGLAEATASRVSQGIPILGICAGMQFLFESSDEMGVHAGLGLLPGRVTRFDPGHQALKVPHMGWNQIEHNCSHALMDGVSSGEYAFFVHSYFCIPAQPATIIASCDYGHRFCAVAGRENVFGIQFHPEKSQRTGLRLLDNFWRRV